MDSSARIDTAIIVIDSTVEAVYAAFTTSRAWEQWLPPEGMTGRIDEFNFREGGQYRLILTYGDRSSSGKTTSNEDISEGTFVELVPNERVVQRIVFDSDDEAFTGAMLMTWLLEPDNRSTRVTITARNVPTGISPEDHTIGLQSTLTNLKRYVEGST